MALSTAANAEDLHADVDVDVDFDRGYGRGRSRGPVGRSHGDTRSLDHSVSWGAIAAGAAAAASLSLILLVLGVGLGLSSVSPWATDGVSAATFGVSTLLWLALTQLVASSLGGYIAGRLRARGNEAHTGEVYFRDSAHGFLAWAVVCLATASLITSVIGSILSGGVQAGASMVGGAAGTASAAVGGAATSERLGLGDSGGPMGYLVDTLFRRDAAAGATGGETAPPVSDIDANERGASRYAAEVSRIFMSVSLFEPLPADDLRYVARIVAQRTGLSQQDAEKRVADVYSKAQSKVREAEMVARDTTDRARKASAYSALWLFVSLLGGALFASLGATFGGRRRDA